MAIASYMLVIVAAITLGALGPASSDRLAIALRNVLFVPLAIIYIAVYWFVRDVPGEMQATGTAASR
jgi:hypothetical protein